jgi:UDP-4-amino-4,6-dideoxy-N-acetyl-beta-L-altrosamine N-acetyltransferase
MPDMLHRVRLVTAADLPLILEWRNHPNIRSVMYNTGIVGLDEHETWFNRTQSDQTICLLLYEFKGVPQGFINFTEAEAEAEAEGKKQAVWGFYLSPYCELKLGQYMGRAALSYGFSSKKYSGIWGEVRIDNIASRKYHERLGFTLKEQCQKEFVNGSASCDICRYLIDDYTFFEKSSGAIE